MALSDTDINHHKVQFKEAVQELAGGPKRSYLKETVGFESCSGESAFIDSMKPALTAGATTAVASTTNRYTYDQIGSPTIGNATDSLLTRNDAVEGQRTMVAPYEIVIGKWFAPSEKSFLEFTDPTSRKMKALMAGYFQRQDKMIIDAIMAAAVNRVEANDASPITVSSITLPVTQAEDINTSTVNIDVNIFSKIKAAMMTQYIAGETIYAGFGPNTWKELVDNSGDKLTNQDYVSSAAPFASGDLPEVYGVTPIIHPLFDDATYLATTNAAFAGNDYGAACAWTDEGVVWAEFQSQVSLMSSPLEAFKGQCVVQINEYADAKRVDDLRVQQLTFTTT